MALYKRNLHRIDLSCEVSRLRELSHYLSRNLLFGITFLVCIQSVQANGFTDLLLSSGYEENLPRGYLAKDTQSSGFLSTSLTAGKLYQPLVNTSLILSASGSFNRYFSQRGFDYGSVGMSISLQQKLGIGAYTPRINIGFAASREDSRGVERDRDLYSFELSISRRINAALSLSFGISQATSRGLKEPAVDFDRLPYLPGVTRPTDPMDYTDKAMFGSLGYTLQNGWLLSAGYRYHDGYVISSAVPPVVPLFIYSQAVALDPAYDHRRLLYLMESTADMWTTSLSIPLSDDTAVDIGYSWQNFDVEYVGGYDNSQILITLVHQF